MVMPESQSTNKPIKVFISYSHDSAAHERRVLSFAVALRNHGIDVELDQFHTDEIIDWPRWCNEQTSRSHSDFVLCACTAEYFRRIEGNVPPEKGKGVYWEGSLLDDDVYDAKGNRRLIPVLFDDEPEQSIPRFLRGWTFCRLHKFTLTDSGYEHVLRILTGQARVIKTTLGTVPVLPTQPLPSAISAQMIPVKIAPTRLRHGAERLVGREKELAKLDAAWHDPKTHVVTIVAWGGVGKTALVVDWMARMAADSWRGAERVFDWSFYSQGTSETTSASSDAFIAKALEFFGDSEMAQSAASPWDKGKRLAHLVAERKTLLVLDGIEPLQYPPGPVAGKLKDPALEALLKGLAQHNEGLCIVTTRESLTDLTPFHDMTAPEWLLEHLSEEAGALLLFDAGVKRAGNAEIKADDQELKDAAREVGGHALTLQLLGRYLAKAHGGDIRRRDQVKFEKADAKVQGGHAFRVMAAYEKWLGGTDEEGKRQLAVLHLLGLFDRPADAGCLAALRREPAIRGLTEPLISLDDDDWNCTLSDLVKCGLISLQSDQCAIDCHSLIHEYFAKQVMNGSLWRSFVRRMANHISSRISATSRAWREAHRRLYEHLTQSTEDRPDTLVGLQPLYHAVAHGCQAGMYQEACEKVYCDRILRGTSSEGGFYSWSELGAFGSNLVAVACFFEKIWTALSPQLSDAAQACLRALGRLTEALELMRAGRQNYRRQENWTAAAITASNISELELTLGQVDVAVQDAERSVDYADRSGDAFERMSVRTTLADTIFQAGQKDEAAEQFHQAEAMQAERQTQYSLLYSVGGFKYCDLLLAPAEFATWQCLLQLKTQRSELITATAACRAVEQRAKGSQRAWREIFINEPSLLDIALDHLSLGRAALYEAILENSKLKTEKSKLAEAAYRLGEAVDGLRQAGIMEYLARGLFSRALLRFVEDDTAGCRADLDEAWQITERGSMRLFMADVLLHRGRLFRDKAALAEAAKLIEECGYHRRDEELADAQEAAKNW
jgi:tetratricopeptide (TPR) repeat protein